MKAATSGHPYENLHDRVGGIWGPPASFSRLPELSTVSLGPRARRPRKLVTAWAILALAILFAMTACTEGTAHDAERGQRLDARRTSVVQSVQETYTSSILKATPPPATTAP